MADGVGGGAWFDFAGSAVILVLIWTRLGRIAHAGKEELAGRV